MHIFHHLLLKMECVFEMTFELLEDHVTEVVNIWMERGELKLMIERHLLAVR